MALDSTPNQLSNLPSLTMNMLVEQSIKQFSCHEFKFTSNLNEQEAT
jgi:hypothetical protein